MIPMPFRIIAGVALVVMVWGTLADLGNSPRNYLRAFVDIAFIAPYIFWLWLMGKWLVTIL